MKTFVQIIFFVLVLVLATLQADGKGETLENKVDLGVGDDEVFIRSHGRKAEIGTKHRNKGAAPKTAENLGLVDSLKENIDDNQSHRYFAPATNPYGGKGNKNKADDLVGAKDSKIENKGAAYTSKPAENNIGLVDSQVQETIDDSQRQRYFPSAKNPYAKGNNNKNKGTEVGAKDSKIENNNIGLVDSQQEDNKRQRYFPIAKNPYANGNKNKGHKVEAVTENKDIVGDEHAQERNIICGKNPFPAGLKYISKCFKG
ncbi:hypothetical protein CCACVL1_28605 [Corchorus capsularis]|uniref:Organ specific protein n=1 Tax=Corchorus capsularis TaxID=210143 RepID=A0A1R3G5W8_COCAP|nr:hypothetical protein CCACVL1_28605 [Corchorus capsularis]